MVSSALLVLFVASSPLELQLHQRRQEQVRDLERIIELSGRQAELLFRLADLWVEESRASLLEGDQAGSSAATKKAIGLFAELAQEHPQFARADEVLFFLGKSLLDTGDERRAMLAFHRLTERHPSSPFVSESHFAMGEFLFAKSNGRRDWLTRALASYVAAAAPGSPVRSDALYKQGWCSFNLQDFAAAQARFREVIAAGGVRASDAERDFVLAYEKGGGKAAGAEAVLEAVVRASSRRRVLTEQLATLYRDDGFDGDAALTWQALIKQDPRAKEAVGYQQQIIQVLTRAGRKPLVVAQVQKLVTMAAESGGDVSEAEPMLAGLATAWHSECRKTKEDGCLAHPAAIYEAYLALFPNAPRAYDLKFFYAELLFAQGEYARAATAYRGVVDRDVECQATNKCVPGRFMESAAWNEIQAREAIVDAALPHEGSVGGIELRYALSPTLSPAGRGRQWSE